ncbi:hypothetical protein DIPPA_06264 [Diplonema papillatum]|nr:hypothetical protein DIPPA_06264 [Diplonema papillatum]
MSQQYKRYDLVWNDGGERKGYKLAVEYTVDMSLVPSEVQELLERDAQGVTWVDPLPALKQNFDLVWEEDGRLVGFEGVVSSKVNVPKLPAAVSRYIRPTDLVKGQPHSYHTRLPLKNHMYTKTSQLIGLQAECSYPKNDTTQPWNGLNGKFTNTFPGGQSMSNTALNCSMTRHSVTKGPSFGTTPYFEGRIT